MTDGGGTVFPSTTDARVVRLADLPEPARRVVLALIDAQKAADARRPAMAPVVVTSSVDGPLSVQPSAERVAVAAPWVAACMSPEEWSEWQRLNPRYGLHYTQIARSDYADRPCADCPSTFAREMREIGCCNGEPGGG